MKHFVIIRFKYPKDEKHLQLRKKLFKEVALHSLEQQTNKDFVTVIVSNLDLDFKSNLNIVYIKDDDLSQPLGFDQSLLKSELDYKDEDYIISSRFDSDDVVLPEFIETIQKTAKESLKKNPEQDKFVIDVSGYYYDARVNKLVVKTTHRPSQFISLVEPSDIPAFVYVQKHRNMGVYPNIVLEDLLKVYYIHATSFTNSRTRPGQLTDSDLAEIPISMQYYIKKWKEHQVEIEKPFKENGVIGKIIKSNWEDIRSLTPKDRRMNILSESGVNGMSTENVRLLFNEIVKQCAINGLYLEVGVFRGCSLLSAALYNTSTQCIGIDNFSQFDTGKRNEKILKENLKKLKVNNASYINGDYIDEIPRLFETLDKKIDVYFYDGEHSYENQLKGLEIVLPYLSEQCVIIIDDINWPRVESANEDFIKKHPEFTTVFKIKTPANASLDWWNGIQVLTRGL